MEYAIETENLAKIYGEGRTRIDVLKDINMAVRLGLRRRVSFLIPFVVSSGGAMLNRKCP